MNIKNLYKKCKSTLKRVAKPLTIFSVMIGATCMAVAFAAPGQSVTLTAVTKNISNTAINIAKILSTVSLIAGIGFVMASFFKFHQHKNNPQQVSMSQGLSLLMIGAGLAVFPVIIPLASSSVFGPTTKVSKVSGSGINKLIGSGS